MAPWLPNVVLLPLVALPRVSALQKHLVALPRVSALQKHLKAEASLALNSGAATDSVCGPNQLVLSEVVHANLGGYGPDKHVNPEILYRGVFPSGGPDVDLAVRATGDFQTKAGDLNGLSGAYGNINVLCGTCGTFEFEFFDHVSGNATEVSPFSFTILDLDGQANGGGTESVEVHGFSSYNVTMRSKVGVETKGDGALFSATVAGKADDNPGDPFQLTQLQQDKSVTVLFPKLSKFSMTMCATTGGRGSGRNFLFTGVTNQMCEPPVRQICKPRVQLELGDLVHANLGGHGPDEGRPGMLYRGVLPASGADVDLAVRAIGEFHTNAAEQNGLNGEVGMVNVLCGTCGTFEFEFLDHVSGLATEVSAFIFTILDFDGQRNGGGNESVEVHGFSEYEVAGSVAVASQEGDGAIFVATIPGTASDNPDDPFQLTQLQENKSVTLNFPKLSTFSMKVCATEGFEGSGRNILFTGATNKVCKPKPPDVCNPGRELELGDLVHANLGGQGPDDGEPVLLYSDVMRRNDADVDLAVRATGAFQTKGGDKNGLSVGGAYGAINVLCGSCGTFEFEFLDHDSGNAVEVPPFLFTILDLDSQANGGGNESVEVHGFHQYEVTELSTVGVESKVDGAIFTSSIPGTATDNPDQSFDLTQLQKDKSVSLFFPSLSKFSMTLCAAEGFEGSGRNFFFTGATNQVCLSPTTPPTASNVAGFRSTR